MENVKVVGIDLSKLVFQLHGVDEKGRIVLQKQVRRAQLRKVLSSLPPCLIGMEACGGAHDWARKIQQMGHQVKVMAPQYVKPYVKSQKNDRADAEAICEAVTRPTMRFVAMKSAEQQDVLVLHRIRQRLIRSRTALANEIRGLLMEYGIVIRQGLAHLKKQLPQIIQDTSNGLSPLSRESFETLWEELLALEARIQRFDQKIEESFANNPEARRLKTIPGVGVLTATAAVASLGTAANYRNGRQVAASLGLVPRQHSTGGKTQLGRMTKSGDCYLRTLLIHGARSVILRVGEKQDRRSCWIRDLVARRGKNRAAVAIANKNARIIWALLKSQEVYRAAA